MKTILAYGDSLTWGMDGRTLSRHPHADLWPTALETALGGAARVINAGLNGRTTMFDDYTTYADRNGVRVLPTILATFEPIDLVIFLLGTNDMKTFTSGSAVGAAQGMKRLIEITRSFPYHSKVLPEVLIVSPPKAEKLGPWGDYPLLSPRTGEVDLLSGLYAEVAKATGSAFFDAATVSSAVTGGDGIHLDAANTRAIGQALAPVAARILGIKDVRAA